jgi:hypothetical protein
MPENRNTEPRPIEEWTDAELLDQYRDVKEELAGEDPDYKYSPDAPLGVIEEEIRRRGLSTTDNDPIT